MSSNLCKFELAPDYYYFIVDTTTYNRCVDHFYTYGFDILDR